MSISKSVQVPAGTSVAALGGLYGKLFSAKGIPHTIPHSPETPTNSNQTSQNLILQEFTELNNEIDGLGTNYHLNSVRAVTDHLTITFLIEVTPKVSV